MNEQSVCLSVPLPVHSLVQHTLEAYVIKYMCEMGLFPLHEIIYLSFTWIM